ncbi:MAG: DUF2723 domain-containing protein [Candidatus Cloacimonetes bacterium]|nr:DUF2723 domain-containing protein [Candidatus Cloacimonadota bacterium]
MNKKKTDARHIKKQIQKQDTEKQKEYKVPERAKPMEDFRFRPQPLENPKLNNIVAWAVFAVVMLVYLLTQARSTSFWDSGEYATCVSILGVPHPPGNPFYVIFGRALVTLFGGLFSHAQIAAFMSGLFSAFASMFTYLITVQLVSMLRVRDWEAMFAGVVASLLTAFSFTFWMNAVEAEVYSGLVFFVNLIIWLTLRWVQNSRDFDRQNDLLLIVYLFFVAFSTHQSALQIAPAILFIVVWPLLFQGSKQNSFWKKFVGYGAALVLSYVFFGLIGNAVNLDVLDKLGFALCIIVLMIIELREVFDPKLWVLSIALVIIGVSAHIYIPIRAADTPFINLGNPSNVESFNKYLARDQYGQTSMFERRGSAKHQLGHHLFRYFGWQWFRTEGLPKTTKLPTSMISFFGMLFVAVISLFGAWFHWKNNKHSFAYLLAIVFCVTLLWAFVLNLSDQEVRDRDYFFVIAYNMWAIWIGIGALAVSRLVNNKTIKMAIVAVMLSLPVLNLALQYREHDRSKEFIALDYGLNFLNSVEENAIIFTNGDNDTYPLWYAQAMADPYAKEYIHEARDIFPTSESEAAIQHAMEYKNKHLKGIRKDVTVANLSLLNTAWYIRQLRDREGVVINWTEDEINSLDEGPNAFHQYLWQDRVNYIAGDPAGEQNFSINYLENAQNSETTGAFYPLRGSDFAALKIVQDNFGKRPIYFAVTCETNVGFDDYLRSEGMVYRVVSTKGEYEEQVDINRLLTNIDKVYQYRSIHDDRVYKDDNMQRLVMNYGSGFNRAAIWFAKQRNFEKALEYAQTAKKFIDSDLRLSEFWVNYYAGLGQLDKLDDFIDQNIMQHPDAIRIYNSYVLNTMAKDYPQYFPRYMKKMLLAWPNEMDYADLAIYYGSNYNLMPQVEALLDTLWIQNKLGYSLQDLNLRMRELYHEEDINQGM